MNQLKPKQSRIELTNQIIKPPLGQSRTKSKRKSQFGNSKPLQQHTVSRNLMTDFKTPPNQQIIQIQPQKSISSVQFSRQILVSQSSDLLNESQASNVTAKSSIKQLAPRQKQNQNSFQLPKSYILALNGLQQGIKARDMEIRKLKKYLKHRISIHQNCSALIQKANQKQAQLQNNVRQLNTEITFLRQNIADFKSQNAQTIKQKILLENQHQNLKDSFNKKSLEQDDQIKGKTKQLKDAETLILQLTRNLKNKQKQLDDRKKEVSQILINEGEQRAKHRSQIQTLKQQIIRLSDKAVLQEMKDKEYALLNQKHKLDALETQLALNKQILKEITSQVNTDIRQRSQTYSKQTYGNEDSNNKQIPRLSISSATKMPQRPSTNAMDLGTNRSRMHRQPPSTTDRNNNLISQYRQLMRHQKQLISFNYQMEQLQKSMSCEKDQVSREQVQRNYGRLKRQIQKKQMIITELKAFLNDPVNKAIN